MKHHRDLPGSRASGAAARDTAQGKAGEAGAAEARNGGGVAKGQAVTIGVGALESIMGEAIMLAAWGGSLKCASQLWAGKAATPAGLDRAMGKIMTLAEASR